MKPQAVAGGPTPVAEVSVVEVLWIDSSYFKGWQDIEEIDPAPVEIRSVGLLLKQDDEGITLTAAASDNGQVHAPITIPWGAIPEWRDL